jgi:hypothetical protein
MTTPICWRPSTGADSVPFPADARLDGPAGAAAYSRYLVDCQEAAKRETADEAVVRCRAEADNLDDGGARFDDVLDSLLSTFDSHVADVHGPNGDQWRDLGFDECIYFGSYSIDRLRHAHNKMSEAFTALDREQYRKAAASFSEVIADFGITWKSTRSPAVAEKGGAA